MRLADRISVAVDSRRDWTLRLLQESLAQGGITGTEGAGALHLGAVGRELGLEVRELTVDRARVGDAFEHWDNEQDLERRPNVLCRWRTAGGGPPLALNGHVDVVPVGDEARWSAPPFSGELRDGRVIGRGAADMKGGLIAAFAAVRALRDEDVEPPIDVEIQCVIAEETGGLGSIALAVTEPAPRAVISMEPTALKLAPAQGGHIKFTLEVEGRAAHTSVPWTGVSAHEHLVTLIHAMQDLADERSEALSHPLFDGYPNKVPFAVGSVSAGFYGWSVPDHATASGRFGLLPSEDLEAARASLVARVAEVAAADPWLAEHPPVLRWPYGAFPPFETPVDTPLVRALIAGSRAITDDAPLTGMTYGTDAAHFVRLAGVPGAIFGPGRIEDCHREDESVVFEDVLTAAKILAMTAMSWGEETSDD